MYYPSHRLSKIGQIELETVRGPSNIVSSIPSRGDYFFFILENYLLLFFSDIFTFVLERSFMFNNMNSRFIFSLFFLLFYFSK